jgi:hypothetical protein
MAWTGNNAAHKRTYVGLFVLEQNKADFDDSADVKMNELRFWTPGSTSDLIRAQARQLAIQLHNIFTMLSGAKLETESTTKKAVNAMAGTISTGTNTIEELADVADEHYAFI